MDVHHVAYGVIYTYEHPATFVPNLAAVMEEQARARERYITRLESGSRTVYNDGLAGVTPQRVMQRYLDRPELQMYDWQQLDREREDSYYDYTDDED